MMGEVIRALCTIEGPVLINTSKLFLERGGVFAVDTPDSVSEAITHLNTGQYDAIIPDYHVPGIERTRT